MANTVETMANAANALARAVKDWSGSAGSPIVVANGLSKLASHFTGPTTRLSELVHRSSEVANGLAKAADGPNGIAFRAAVTDRRFSTLHLHFGSSWSVLLAFPLR